MERVLQVPVRTGSWRNAAAHLVIGPSLGFGDSRGRPGAAARSGLTAPRRAGSSRPAGFHASPRLLDALTTELQCWARFLPGSDFRLCLRQCNELDVFHAGSSLCLSRDQVSSGHVEVTFPPGLGVPAHPPHCPRSAADVIACPDPRDRHTGLPRVAGLREGSPHRGLCPWSREVGCRPPAHGGTEAGAKPPSRKRGTSTRRKTACQTAGHLGPD